MEDGRGLSTSTDIPGLDTVRYGFEAYVLENVSEFITRQFAICWEFLVGFTGPPVKAF